MRPKSIRWRLPLQFGGIALLAVVLLGLVLMLSLRTYYSRRESDYLAANAGAIGTRLSVLVGPEVPASALAYQVQVLSSLSQTRVRLLGLDGDVLADSGEPQRFNGVTTLSVESGGQSQTISETVDGTERRFFSLFETGAASGSTKDERIRIAESIVVRSDQPGAETLSAGGLLPLPGQPLSLVPGLQPELEFGVSPGGTKSPRSDKVVRQPVYDGLLRLNGYVELSRGPAFGREVLRSVAWGWALAGAVAVTVAAAVGWRMSLGITRPLSSLAQAAGGIARGDLSGRADIHRGDELGDLATSFNQMAQRVEDTVLSLRRFVADAAHQLLTPLTALRTNLDVVDASADREDQRELLEDARVQLDRLEALSRSLIDLSRLEAGAEDPVLMPLHLDALLREIIEPAASRAEQAELELELGRLEPILVRGDEGKLRQAVGNLLDNAIKFTPPGGKIAVSLTCEDGWSVLVVEDTGIGFGDQDPQQLFERFRRGRNSGPYPGSGLGLAIVKVIAEAHGGTAEAVARPDGSRFVIRLPLAE